MRLEAVIAHDGTLLREVDVTIADAPDPHMPRVTVRRARRSDPLTVLYRVGTIDRLQVDAGELYTTYHDGKIVAAHVRCCPLGGWRRAVPARDLQRPATPGLPDGAVSIPDIGRQAARGGLDTARWHDRRLCGPCADAAHNGR